MIFFTGTGTVFSSRNSFPVTLEMQGANANAPWQPAEDTGEVVSYQVGRDSRRWADNVPQYARLTRRGVYPGIDVVYYGTDRRFEYDFVLAPGADPGRIRIRVQGAQAVSIDPAGDLVISAEGGEIREHKPVLYQTGLGGTRVPVPGEFQLPASDNIGFHVGPYDRRKPLTIDPSLESATYLGGLGDDKITSATLNGYGGTTTSADFPDATPARKSSTDVFMRVGSNTLVLGGSGDDELTGIQVSSVGYFAVVGYTNSIDLPTMPGVLQPQYGGGPSDGFIGYYNLSTGGRTITYFGTSGEDRITAIANSIAYSSMIGFTGWTTGRNFPIASSRSPVDGPGGGIDGFLVTGIVTSSSSTLPTFTALRFFGGTGDDRPQGLTYSNSDRSGYYVTGESNSADFPGLTPVSAARSGDSDAFVTYYSGSSLVTSPSSVLYGGNGSDRAAGVTSVTWSGTVVIAGTTTSTDLPLMNPLQSTYAGGASDGFVAQFSNDLMQMTFATYWGGSGTDEFTSASGAAAFFVGGWTTSPDLPVLNPIQASFGGSEDGFLMRFDEGGVESFSTYYGGSSSDRILSMTTTSGSSITIAGQTSSSDLPLANASQGDLRGGSDGFIATIKVDSHTIQANPVAGSNGFRAASNITVLTAPVGLTVTITSSDPAVVLVSSTLGGDASASTTFELLNESADYYFDCLANDTGADLTISAPGYFSKTVHADCVAPTFDVSAARATLRVSVWGDPLQISVYLKAVSPSNPLRANSVFAKSDADLIPADIVVSDPSVATTTVSTLLVGRYSTQQRTLLRVVPLAVGATQISLVSPLVPPRDSDHFDLVVTPPFSPNTPAPISGGFQNRYYPSISGNIPLGTTITVTSSDPAALLVSTDPAQTGSGSITLPVGGSIYLQAQSSSGEVPLSVAIGGFDPVTVPVTLQTPVLSASGTVYSSSTLGPQETVSLYANLGIPNPGNTVEFTLDSTDPQVLKVTPASIQADVLNPSVTFKILAVAPGTATLTLRTSLGVELPAELTLRTLTVVHRPIPLRDMEVGKDLRAQVAIVLPVEASAGAAVTVTSADPSKVLVSSMFSDPGEAQISTSVSSSRSVSFYVSSLSDSGQTKILLDVAGFGSASAVVNSVPSGFGWTVETLVTDVYDATRNVSLVAYALDPVTHVPIAQQFPRTGAAGVVAVRNDRPDIAVVLTNSVTIPSPNFVFSVQNLYPGDAKLAVVQPDGFTVPASRTVLTYRVAKAYVRVSGPNLVGINTQARYTLNVPVVLRKPVTITSGNPAKLLLSTDPTKSGTPAITVDADSPFFVQALDNRGVVTIVASLEGFTDNPVPIRLNASSILVSAGGAGNGSEAGSIVKDGNNAYTTLSSGTTQVDVGVRLVDLDTGTYNFAPGLLIGPGIDPQITIQSLDPTIGVIEGSPVPWDGSSSSVSVRFRPVALGETIVSAVPPPGFTIPADSTPIGMGKIHFVITQPTWEISQYQPQGKDTMRTFALSLAANVPRQSVNVPVTITSADPSRVLLSPDATTSGSASLNLTLIAGQRSLPFMVHALDSQGSVHLTISAPGFEDAGTDIALTETLFGINLNSRVILQGGPVKAWIVFGTSNSSGGIICLGAAPTVHIESSDPSVLAIDTPDVTLDPGAYSGQFIARPIRAGQATVTLQAPPGYGLFPAGFAYSSTVNVTVDGVRLTFFSSSGTVVGKDLQLSLSAGTELTQGMPSDMVFTVSSSDPGVALVSGDPATPGSATASIPVRTSTYGASSPVYVQALAGTGSITVTATAPDAVPATLSIQLVPSAIVFTNTETSVTLTANGSSQHVYVGLTSLDPSTFRPTGTQLGRAGWTGSIGVTSSDPNVVAVTPGSLQWPAPQGAFTQIIELKPHNAGTAIVSLGLLPGGETPAIGRQLVVNVR